MPTFISAVHPSGNLVIVRLPAPARFTATYVDEQAPRDITHLVADLLLAGALDHAEATAAGRPEPAEAVTAAVVTYTEATLPGAAHVPASFTWAHLPTRTAGDFDPAQVLGLVVRGVGVLLTEGVAAEAAAGTVPDDASTLTDPESGDPVG